MNINKDIFECAANSLNLSELRLALEEHNIDFSMKDKKHQLIEKLINLIDNNEMTEELYLSIRTKAFSDSNNCNEGFYYKYIDENISFNYDNFVSILKEEMDSEKKSKYGTNIFKYNMLNLQHNEVDKLITFTFIRETKTKRYDYVDNNVKVFNEIIKVNIEINYADSLIYIQSKNYNNSNSVKFFLEKVINKLRIDKKATRVQLVTPKFDGQVVSKWASENKIDIKGISSMTINMLDLLSEFENEENNFTGYCMKKIYFGDEVIDTKEKNRVKGSIFFGDDIKECIEISEGILNGKKINGFELLVDYQYLNEELGWEPEIVQVPITILQEGSSTVRIAISKELATVEKDILEEIYECIRKVFTIKIRSNKINNTNDIRNFISRAKEILRKKGEEAKSKRDKAVVL